MLDRSGSGVPNPNGAQQTNPVLEMRPPNCASCSSAPSLRECSVKFDNCAPSRLFVPESVT